MTHVNVWANERENESAQERVSWCEYVLVSASVCVCVCVSACECVSVCKGVWAVLF